ncbi:hypothetical protein GF319_11130 [Candidatus Bathyarchaeota archaeon]|nr:hypothetical protein [Candidatus Bathyarchaeota archaeon]
MRSYILTDSDRERLLLWLEEDIEDQHTRNIFSQIRKNITPLRQDLHLILAVIKKLRQERRWRSRSSRGGEMGRALLMAEQKLKTFKRIKRSI